MSDITRRPQNVAYRPERVSAQAPDKEWTMHIGGVVSFIHEKLLAESYADRRKAGRKIRQQRRRLRRINAEFGHGPGEGVPMSILGARIVI